MINAIDLLKFSGNPLNSMIKKFFLKNKQTNNNAALNAIKLISKIELIVKRYIFFDVK